MERLNKKHIIKDLDKKMVFLSGPRQSGKTTLAKSLISEWKNIEYLNYDSDEDRSIFMDEIWDQNKDLLILDEVHKYKNWKNKIKGIFDTKTSQLRIIVTGSTRLNVYHRTGDSLAGRYFHRRLYPFSYKEIKKQFADSDSIIDDMIQLGNFPEPFLSSSSIDSNRWRKQYLDLVLTHDVHQLADIKDYSSMLLIVDLLRERVGSPVSFNSIARDLEISPITVKRYIEILEYMYLIFKVTPYNKNVARAILKEPKIYFYDTAMVKGDDGTKLENLIAFHLQKHLHYLEDTLGHDVKLHYIKDKQKHEVDFYFSESKNDLGTLMEVKLSDNKPSKNLVYFKKKLNLRSIQVVGNLKRKLQFNDTFCIPAHQFLDSLAI